MSNLLCCERDQKQPFSRNSNNSEKPPKIPQSASSVDLSVSDDMVIYSVCMKFNNTKGLITKL